MVLSQTAQSGVDHTNYEATVSIIEVNKEILNIPC